MNASQFDAQMRQFEIYHQMKVPPQQWIVIRVDGRTFHTVTENLEKPFDGGFHATMVYTAKALVEEFSGIYGFTESDEISVLLGPENDLFGRSVEKLVSLSASAATVAYCANARGAFDSRLVVLPNVQSVVDYFSWRQADAARCALNGWAYWTLRKAGLSAPAATKVLEGMSEPRKHELLFQCGINFAEVPAWQRNGTGVTRQPRTVVGYNHLGQEQEAIRSELVAVESLPFGEAYREIIRELVQESAQREVKVAG